MVRVWTNERACPRPRKCKRSWETDKVCEHGETAPRFVFHTERGTNVAKVYDTLAKARSAAKHERRSGDAPERAPHVVFFDEDDLLRVDDVEGDEYEQAESKMVKWAERADSARRGNK